MAGRARSTSICAGAHEPAPPVPQDRARVVTEYVAFGLPGLVILTLLGVLVARAALTTARTPQGAVGWVVFLISFPLLAIPAYAVFGGMTRLQRSAQVPRPQGDAAPGRGRLAQLSGVAGVPVTTGNAARLLIDGRETFDAVFAAIDAAETEVLVQFYIIRSDALGLALRDRLVAAAGRGVRVAVLCDVIGSLLLGRRYVRELRAAGCEIRGIPGPHRTLRRVGINFRNHRKAVVVDGRIGFTGGINAGQEYLDGGRAFSAWRDTFVRLEGPMVGQLRALFAADWRAITGREPPPPPASPAGRDGDVAGMVVGFGPSDPLEKGSLLICGLIGLARRRLWLTTPYLVPHADLLTALQLAALRGVDVRVIVPKERDHILPWYASRDYFEPLIRAGASVHEYRDGFMHQKVVLVDDDVAAVGSVNLDIRSLLLNFELTALMEGERIAADVERMLEADLDRSTPAPARSPNWKVRLFAPVARLFAPLL